MQTTQDNEPMISKFALEMIDATHQKTIDTMTKAHRRVVWILSGLLLIALIIIGYGVWMWNQYDTISYTQDGKGINIIGDDNRGYYNEPEIEDSTETE